MNDKIYWSGNFSADKWGEGSVLTFFYIPKRWWSIADWKFALSMRASMNKELVKLLGEL